MPEVVDRITQRGSIITSKTPDVAIDERGLVRNVHFFVCVHNAVKYYIVY